MLNIAKKLRIYIISTIDWFHKPFSKYISSETFRYGVTGGTNSIFDIFLFYIFYNFILDKKILDLKIVAISPHIAAFMFVFPITFTTGFLLAKYITFTQSVLKGKIQLFRYCLSVAGSIMLNYLLLKLFVEVAYLYATLSKFLTTIIVIAYSFIIQKHFTFRTGKKALAKAILKDRKEN
jgi:putative flippase GtrA